MIKKIDPRYEDFLFDRLSDIGHPNDFAEYIEKGGDITDEMRAILGDLVRNRMPKPRGKSDKSRDLEVWWEVEEWRREIALLKTFSNSGNLKSKKPRKKIYTDIDPSDVASIEDFELIEAEIRKNYPPKDEAYNHFSSDEEDEGVDKETYKKQYERSEKLMKGFTTSSHLDTKRLRKK